MTLIARGWEALCGCDMWLREDGRVGHEVTKLVKQCPLHKGMLPQQIFEDCIAQSIEAQKADGGK